MRKKIISLLLAATMVMGMLLTGCGEGKETEEKDADTVVIQAAFPESSVVDYANLEIWDEIEEKFNVRFEVEEMSGEKITLMFTSGDYVDVLFSAPSDSQIQLAATSGDVVELTDGLLTAHAPTWKKFFEENPDFYNASKYEGDKLYSLPYIRTVEADRGVRDVWWINKTWLDELNLNMPETLDDFVKILRAFRDNAGIGSIPENVMPWYLNFDGFIGGQFDFLASYGLEAYDNTYMALDGNGTVVNYATDPRIKTAVQQLSSMYAEGLIAPESMTDGPVKYVERVNSETGEKPYIGVCTAYWMASDEYVPMTLFQSLPDTEPKIRQQPLGVIRNRTVIFSECKYPEKVLDIMEWIAQEETTMYNDFGREGEAWDYDETSDTYTVHANKDGEQLTPSNAWSGMLDDRFKDRLVFDEDHSWAKRQTAIEMYGDNRIELNHIMPPLCFSATAVQKADTYKKNIFTNYVSASMRKWITGTADVTSDWDEYVSQVNALGLQDYISLYQTAYDSTYK